MYVNIKRAAAVLLGFFVLVASVDWDTYTALDEYVAREDGIFSWKELERQDMGNFTLHILNVTSCRWLDINYSNRPIWFHWVTVAIPKEIRFFDTAAMYIDGGSNNGSPPDIEDNEFLQLVGKMAEELGMVTAYLNMIPNQPIIFKADPEQKGRSEDDAIAYTWRDFLNAPTRPAETLLQFPMTKGAKRAFDAVAEVAKLEVPETDIVKTIPAGGSKRGWITWLLGAVDRRVVAMSPMVLSCLNMVENFNHYYQSLGGWSFAMVDYHNFNITGDMNHPHTELMASHVDPFAYKERLTMPKYIVSAVGDEFFQMDDYYYFFDELPNPKYTFMLPNAEHSLFPWYNKIYQGLKSVALAVMLDIPFPQLSWTRTEGANGGSITLQTDRTPSFITSWHGENNHPERRDFRYAVADFPYVNPIIWTRTDVEVIGENLYKIEHSHTLNGTYTGFFIEIDFTGPENTTFSFTTEVHITPDILPYPKCEGFDMCQGDLV